MILMQWEIRSWQALWYLPFAFNTKNVIDNNYLIVILILVHTPIANPNTNAIIGLLINFIK